MPTPNKGRRNNDRRRGAIQHAPPFQLSQAQLGRARTSADAACVLAQHFRPGEPRQAHRCEPSKKRAGSFPPSSGWQGRAAQRIERSAKPENKPAEVGFPASCVPRANPTYYHDELPTMSNILSSSMS